MCLSVDRCCQCDSVTTMQAAVMKIYRCVDWHVDCRHGWCDPITTRSLLSVRLCLVLSFSSCVSFMCFSVSPFLEADVRYVNTTALIKGHLHSSFWVVDRRHFYIGSASMDWRSLATVPTIHHATEHTYTETHIRSQTCSHAVSTYE